jgi:hypothetical protein
MHGAIAAKLFGVGRQLIGIDDRRVVFAAIVTIEPGENERDLVLGRRLELFTGPGGKVDFARLCAPQDRRNAKIAAVSAAIAVFITCAKNLFFKA